MNARTPDTVAWVVSNLGREIQADAMRLALDLEAGRGDAADLRRRIVTIGKMLVGAEKALAEITTALGKNEEAA